MATEGPAFKLFSLTVRQLREKKGGFQSPQASPAIARSSHALYIAVI
jgi:hypothetical protein